MPIVPYNGTAPVAGATVTVFLAGTEDLATLYSDALLTPLGNPLTADLETGAYLFYAEQQAYDIELAQSADDPTIDAAPAQVVFNGTTPSRVATLYATDPITGQQIILIQVVY